jgi:hypothetical protein
MSKPTFASVTEVPCTCRYLEKRANDPRTPIVFDEATGEYQFVYKSEMLVIYHCPFCGGAAPESKRALLFAQISAAEEERLANLLDGITTIDDALAKLGKPDFEGTSVTRHPEAENEAPRIQHHRDIRYFGLSETAEVWITERPDGKIFWQLQGKYIGRESAVGLSKALPTEPRWWQFWKR